MKIKYKSRRGVYYDLSKSPYEFKDNFNQVFKFSSQKKLDMFVKKIEDRQTKWNLELMRLRQLGYEISKDYEANYYLIPERVYNEMQYK